MDPMNQSKGKASPKTSRPQGRKPGSQGGRGGGANRAQPGRERNYTAVQDRLQKQVKQQPQRSVAAAYATGVSQNEPVIMRGPDWVRIVHKELVANVVGSANFTVATTIPLQPGLPTFLKWLATQAVGWETYMWNKLEFHSFTRTGSNIPGSLSLIPDYDAEDAAPTDEISASSYKDLVEDAPWKDICCKLPKDRLHPLGKRLFLRTGAVGGTDIKTYDAGNLFIATTDGTAVNWSKVWCYYDVTLHTPQLPPGGMVALSNVLHITGTTQTTANAFPNQTVGVGSNSGIATVPATGEIITFNVPGRYLVSYYSLAATTTTQTGAPAVSASGSLVTSYFIVGEEVGGSATTSFFQNIVLNAVSGTTLTFNNTIVAGTSYDLTIVGMSTLAN